MFAQLLPGLPFFEDGNSIVYYHDDGILLRINWHYCELHHAG